MTHVLKESTIGQIIYRASGRRVFSYPEERDGFVIPDKYKPGYADEKKQSRQRRFSADELNGNGDGDSGNNEATREGVERRTSDETVVGQVSSRDSGSGNNLNGEKKSEPRFKSRSAEAQEKWEAEQARKRREERQEEEEESSDVKKDGTVVVGWYGDDDLENPQNWSTGKKCWTTFCIMLITISVYMGSSIVSPAIMQFSEVFQVGTVTSTLTLSLFVVGYGVGPLFLSPITEIPQIGRSIPYIVTLAIFCALQAPTATVTNFAGLCILRFFAGFIGSPPLATGGASLQDCFAPHKLPYAMGLYGLAASSGPALAPVISGYAVTAKGWRWSFYEMLWLSGFSLALLAFTMPETSAQNILYRRAQRLRKLTGNDKLKSQGEIDGAKMTGGELVKTTLLRPFTMTFTEPIVLAINIYIGLIYAVLYSYFESFPRVYLEGYGFLPGNSNLPFLALLVGSFISYALYCVWNKLYFEKKFVESKGHLKPEARIPPSMLGAFMFPICLFWFAWTANKTAWISPVIASSFFGLGATWMFMPFLTYLPHAYPQYAASVLASNDFFRSMMGAGMPLVATPMFNKLGIAWGNTLLGCLTVVFIPIPFVLYRYGSWLRHRSPNAMHDDAIDKQDDADV